MGASGVVTCEVEERTRKYPSIIISNNNSGSDVSSLQLPLQVNHQCVDLIPDLITKMHTHKEPSSQPHDTLRPSPGQCNRCLEIKHNQFAKCSAPLGSAHWKGTQGLAENFAINECCPLGRSHHH